MSTIPPQDPTYIFDIESGAETARLVDQHRLFTEAMGGLLPERPDFARISRVLDVACGPGGWVFDVASTHPQIDVVGVDISHTMIQYARAYAQVQRLGNATFQEMNVLEPLDFPDNSFDLVNARALGAFMTPSSWPKLVQECLRITRPGGFIRLTESDDVGISNSPALEKMWGYFLLAWRLTGRSFSQQGRTPCLTPMLPRLLREAGYQRIGHRAFAIDYSAGAEAHHATCHDFMMAIKLFEPFVTKLGITTPEAFQPLYQQIMNEMQSDDFVAMWYFLSVWGEKL